MKQLKTLVKYAILISVVIFMVPLQATSAGKTYTLKLADTFPLKHPASKFSKKFMDVATKESNGRLKFKHFPAQQLGKVHDMLKICQQGLADITYVGVSFFPGQLPLNSMIILPYYTTALDGTTIYRRLIKESPELQQEWARNRVLPLMASATSQYQVQTSNYPLNQVSDLRGLRLKSSGGVFEMIAKRYGIVPISMAANELYEAIQRNILDGAIFSNVSIKGYRLQEVENHFSVGMRMGGYPSTYVINEKKFRKLPPELQEVLLKAGEETSFFAANLWDKFDNDMTAFLEKSGKKLYRITPDNQAKWFAPLKGIGDEWAAQYEEKGLPAKSLLEKFRKIAKEVTSGK